MNLYLFGAPYVYIYVYSIHTHTHSCRIYLHWAKTRKHFYLLVGRRRRETPRLSSSPAVCVCVTDRMPSPLPACRRRRERRCQGEFRDYAADARRIVTRTRTCRAPLGQRSPAAVVCAVVLLLTVVGSLALVQAVSPSISPPQKRGKCCI